MNVSIFVTAITLSSIDNVPNLLQRYIFLLFDFVIYYICSSSIIVVSSLYSLLD